MKLNSFSLCSVCVFCPVKFHKPEIETVVGLGDLWPSVSSIPDCSVCDTHYTREIINTFTQLINSLIFLEWF